jgi:hypothetical protein
MLPASGSGGGCSRGLGAYHIVAPDIMYQP